MLTYFLLFLFLIVLELAYFRLADRYNIIDRPNERSSHTQVTRRGGGIIFVVGMWLWAAFFGLHYPWFLLGLTLIAGISFVDDVHSLPDSVRLVVQFLSMGLLLFEFAREGGLVSPGSSLLTSLMMGAVILVVAVGIINAFNFMDGINGITGGYTIAVLLPLLYVDTVGLASAGLQAPYVEPSLLLVALLGALVFCFFNFRTRAWCFAGDVGSVGVAFILVFALGRLILQTSDLTYIVFLAVYGVDVTLTIGHRILLHEHLGEAHRKHAYQLMANELRIPHTIVSTLYAALQLLISAGLIWVPCPAPYAVGVLSLLCVGYVLFMWRYYPLHAAYLRQSAERT